MIAQAAAAAAARWTPIYETDMAEGLKAMALEGHGLAFLPASSVQEGLRARRLVPRRRRPGVRELTMEVRIYRERPEVGQRRSSPAPRRCGSILAMPMRVNPRGECRCGIGGR